GGGRGRGSLAHQPGPVDEPGRRRTARQGPSMTDPDVLEVSVHIKAPPETVFGYFTDPVKYPQWMGSEVTIEATPGGRYRVKMRDGVEVSGQFVEVEEPRRIVFTWGWTHDLAVAPGSTRVEVSLTEDGDGTIVVFRHHALPDAAH